MGRQQSMTTPASTRLPPSHGAGFGGVVGQVPPPASHGFGAVGAVPGVDSQRASQLGSVDASNTAGTTAAGPLVGSQAVAPRSATVASVMVSIRIGH
jgi:hypothetical protein